MQEARVTLDGIGTYDAVIADHRWNGWAIPRFTLQVAEQIVADFARFNGQHIAEGGDVADCELLKWDGDDIIVTSMRGTPDEHSERVTVDEDGFFHIGGMSWTWSVVDNRPLWRVSWAASESSEIGELTLRASDFSTALRVAAEELTDVDFLRPAMGYSASHPDVVGGTHSTMSTTAETTWRITRVVRLDDQRDEVVGVLALTHEELGLLGMATETILENNFDTPSAHSLDDKVARLLAGAR